MTFLLLPATVVVGQCEAAIRQVQIEMTNAELPKDELWGSAEVRSALSDTARARVRRDQEISRLRDIRALALLAAVFTPDTEAMVGLSVEDAKLFDRVV